MNVKCTSWCVKILHINFGDFFWICILRWLQLDSIQFLIAKRTIAHSCYSARIFQFSILSKHLTLIFTFMVPCIINHKIE
jgi:hypothetical protein